MLPLLPWLLLLLLLLGKPSHGRDKEASREARGGGVRRSGLRSSGRRGRGRGRPPPRGRLPERRAQAGEGRAVRAGLRVLEERAALVLGSDAADDAADADAAPDDRRHEVRSIHWSPYAGVGVVNADP